MPTITLYTHIHNLYSIHKNGFRLLLVLLGCNRALRKRRVGLHRTSGRRLFLEGPPGGGHQLRVSEVTLTTITLTLTLTTGE